MAHSSLDLAFDRHDGRTEILGQHLVAHLTVSSPAHKRRRECAVDAPIFQLLRRCAEEVVELARPLRFISLVDDNDRHRGLVRFQQLPLENTARLPSKRVLVEVQQKMGRPRPDG